MSRKVPADEGGKKQVTGGPAGRAPGRTGGRAGTTPGTSGQERPPKGYGGSQGGNAGKHPKKDW